MQIVKLSVPVPSIGPAVDVHVRTVTPRCNCGRVLSSVRARQLHAPTCGARQSPVAWAAAYDRQTGAWVLPETPESVAELLAAAGVVLR